MAPASPQPHLPQLRPPASPSSHIDATGHHEVEHLLQLSIHVGLIAPQEPAGTAAAQRLAHQCKHCVESTINGAKSKPTGDQAAEAVLPEGWHAAALTSDVCVTCTTSCRRMPCVMLLVECKMMHEVQDDHHAACRPLQPGAFVTHWLPQAQVPRPMGDTCSRAQAWCCHVQICAQYLKYCNMAPRVTSLSKTPLPAAP
jgi:hypothetical protein